MALPTASPISPDPRIAARSATPITTPAASALSVWYSPDTSSWQFVTQADMAAAVGAEGGGSGTVTTVSVTTANGVSGSVATATTTPAITLTLGAIVPSSVAASGTVTGSNLSGTNTGDQNLAPYAPLASPTLTGTPVAPTAAPGTNTTQLATTAFTRAEIAALIASSPATLDTLNELALALGSDPDFATTMTTALAGKASTTHVHAAGDVTTGQFAMARLASGTPNGTKFVRDDGALAVPASSISTTEIDFGTTPVSEASFLITDASVTASSRIIGGVAYVAPTGKDLDELEMDGLDLKFAPGTGQFTVYARGLDGYVADKFVLFYQVGS